MNTTITRTESDQILAAACWDHLNKLAGRVTPEAIKKAAFTMATRLGENSPTAVSLALSLALETLMHIEQATAAEARG